jgi:hypothetical protein
VFDNANVLLSIYSKNLGSGRSRNPKKGNR